MLVGVFLVGVVGILEGRVFVLVFFGGGFMFFFLLIMVFLIWCLEYGMGLGGWRMYFVFLEFGILGCW